MVQSGENMQVAARVQFRVWLRNVAQVQPSALVRCRGGFANNLTTTVLVACGVLRRGDTANFLTIFLIYCVTLRSELIM